MFTGIITHQAEIKSLEVSPKKDSSVCIAIKKNLVKRDLTIGCSIASNGICLTLIEQKIVDDLLLLAFQASEETWHKTTLKNWHIGQKINLEFSLRVGDELGGHFVLGHVDDVGVVKNILAIKESWQFDFSTPINLRKFIAAKGSITINGTALTVNSVDNDVFSVNIIDHTMRHTTFELLKIGDEVNLEIDPLARYAKST